MDNKILEILLDISKELNHPEIDWARGNAKRIIKEATEL